jgi:hypothetical protein
MKNLFLIGFIYLLASCNSQKEEFQEAFHYPIKSYFNSEVLKLKEKNSTVLKTITHNDVSESKELKIEDWEKEFALFLESDINKTSWKNGYTKDSTSNKITYKAIEEGLRTKFIEIDLIDHKPVKFKITNSVKNYLYSSQENLEYIPDSIYTIQKTQKTVILGENKYKIEGKFK